MTKAMNEVRFHLAIPAERYLAYYRGAASHVEVTADGGARLRFPARLLRPYVTPEGVYGRFLLRYDDDYRAVCLERTSL